MLGMAEAGSRRRVAAEGEPQMTTRLNVNINDETAAALRELAERRQTTVTEIVRRAVSVYKFVEDEVVDGNKVLKLVSRDGQETIVSVL
jgi:hypothetical protein